MRYKSALARTYKKTVVEICDDDVYVLFTMKCLSTTGPVRVCA